MEDYKLSTGDSKNETSRVTKDRLYPEQRGRTPRNTKEESRWTRQ